MHNTKNSSTKKSLVLSALSLMLCIAMLLGTTYAWFTDSVTSGKNRIVAGNLDVEMYYKNALTSKGKTGDAQWANVVTANEQDPMFFVDAAGEKILWEPGVVAVTSFKVENLGSLALKYDFKTIAAKYNTVKNKNKSLKDVIKFAVINGTQTFTSRDEALEAADDAFGDFETFADSDSLNAGASKEFTVIAYWEPGVLNDDDYNLKNGLTSSDGAPLFVDIEIQLVATQYTAEVDSFDNLYDKLAELPAWSADEISDKDKEKFEEQVDNEEKTVEIFTAQDLVLFAADIDNYKNYTVELKNDIDLGGKKWTPIDLAAGGVWNDTKSTLTINGNGHTISNLAIPTRNNSGFIGYTSAAKITMSDLTFESPKISADNGSTGYGAVIGRLTGSAELTNVDVNNATIIGEISSKTIRLGGLIGVVEASDGNCKEVKLTDCDVTNSTIEGFHNVGGFIGTVQNAGNVNKITATNCSVKNCTLFYGATAGVGAHAIANDAYTDVPINGVITDNVVIQSVVADGFYANGKTYAEATTFYVANAAGLKYFADMVNREIVPEGFGAPDTTSHMFNGKTVVLTADIDLKNEQWTPIGYNKNNVGGKAMFAGTFDGNNHTIKNIYVNNETVVSKNSYLAGLFGSLNSAVTVKDLTIENATVHNANSYAGALAGQAYKTGVKISNVKVCGNVDITAANHAGALLGYNVGTIENCTVDVNAGSKVSSAWHVGGLISLAHTGTVVKDCTVKGITLETTSGGAAGIAGFYKDDITITGCSVSDVTIIGTKVGEIIAHTDVPITSNTVNDNTATNVRFSVDATPDTLDNIMKYINDNTIVTLGEGSYDVLKMERTPAEAGKMGGTLHNVTFVAEEGKTVIFKGVQLRNAQNCTIEGVTFYADQATDVVNTFAANTYDPQVDNAGAKASIMNADFRDKDGSNNITIKNCVFTVFPENASYTAANYRAIDLCNNKHQGNKSLNLTVEGCTFDCHAQNYITLNYNGKSGNDLVTVKNNTFGSSASGAYSTIHSVISATGSKMSVDIEGNTFYNWGRYIIGSSMNAADESDIYKFTVKGNTFNNEKAVGVNSVQGSNKVGLINIKTKASNHLYKDVNALAIVEGNTFLGALVAYTDATAVEWES